MLSARFISPAAFFGKHVTEEFMGWSFIIGPPVHHPYFWALKIAFHKPNSFLHSWQSSLIYLGKGAEKSKCPADLALDDLLPSQTSYSFFLIFYMLWCAAFPHEGVECNGNHHYHGSCNFSNLLNFFFHIPRRSLADMHILSWFNFRS